MTEDRLIDRWEQDQEMLREVLAQFGHEMISDQHPSSGRSSASDPHTWWAPESSTGDRPLASFYSKGGVLTLHEPGCDPRVAEAFNALRREKREMH